MTETEYWSALEHRLSRELAGMPQKHKGAMWCDGIMPLAYWHSDDPPRIEGEAFLGYDGQQPWRFTLFLPQPYARCEDIPWATLFPADNVTCWIAIDEPKRFLQIEPGAAVPDLP